MTDRTPTEPTQEGTRMLIKGDRYAYDAPDDAEIAPPPIDWAHRAARGIICNLTDRKAIKRGFEEIDEEIRVEIVDSMADIIRAASPPAPGAEVGPVAGLRYRSLEYDDWGMIRNADDSLFAVIRRPLGEDEAGAHRKAKTDPFEPLARVLMSALSSPPTTDAIRAQARREALEEAAAWHDGKADIARVDAERFRGGTSPHTQRRVVMASHMEAARAIRELAGKPGGGGAACEGCDGYNCDDGCAYPDPPSSRGGKHGK